MKIVIGDLWGIYAEILQLRNSSLIILRGFEKLQRDKCVDRGAVAVEG